VGLYDKTGDLLRAIEKHLSADGYKRIKIKIEPGRDMELVRAVQSRFPGVPLMTDANAAYCLNEHLAVFRQLDELGLMMFEQPLAGEALEDSARLQAQLRTPICLDESLESEAALLRAIQLGSFRIANIKIQRVGGFRNALRMHGICVRHNIPVWIGTMPELGIAQAHGAALASLHGCDYPTDVEASLRWFVGDIIEPVLEVSGGRIRLPQTPGLGYRVNRNALARYRVAERVFD
jgi:O-succinylbenzoate synthase